MKDFDYINIGGNRVRAQLIERACTEAGIHVELLPADDTGLFPTGGFIQRHRLLVRSADRAKVEEIIEETR
ncbi:MAG: hypothetical protein WAM81_03350 [Acidimicrobiia bacterium]